MTAHTGSFNGVSFGSGTQYPIVASPDLMDMPSIKARDRSRSSYDGDFSAPDFTDNRIITLRLGLWGETPENLQDLRLALWAATAPQAAPIPLVLDDFMVFAKPRRRHIPDDRTAAWRIETDAVIEFYCADPRVFSAEENVVSTPLPTAVGGLTIPITIPLSLGSGATGGGVQAFNSGNASAPVKITYSGGDLVNPGSTLQSTGQILKMGFTLTPTDSLELNTETHAVTLNASTSRRIFLTVDQWFSLQPGDNFVTFEADSSAGSPTMELRWRSAWL